MVRKRNVRKDPASFVGVGLHPELHKLVAHDCVDSGQTIRERVNEIVAKEYRRLDLLKPAPAAS